MPISSASPATTPRRLFLAIRRSIRGPHFGLQSWPVILDEVHFRPDSPDRPIEARPMIDVEPWRALSLDMHPFEYGRVIYGRSVKKNRIFEKQPKTSPGNVDSDRAFHAGVVAEVASDRRIGLIEPNEGGDLRFVRATEVGESSRQLDISS